MTNKRKPGNMTIEENFGLSIIKSKLPTASDAFLKRSYVMLKQELKDRGILKPKDKPKDK